MQRVNEKAKQGIYFLDLQLLLISTEQIGEHRG